MFWPCSSYKKRYILWIPREGFYDDFCWIWKVCEIKCFNFPTKSEFDERITFFYFAMLWSSSTLYNSILGFESRFWAFENYFRPLGLNFGIWAIFCHWLSILSFWESILGLWYSILDIWYLILDISESILNLSKSTLALGANLGYCCSILGPCELIYRPLGVDFWPLWVDNGPLEVNFESLKIAFRLVWT